MNIREKTRKELHKRNEKAAADRARLEELSEREMEAARRASERMDEAVEVEDTGLYKEAKAAYQDALDKADMHRKKIQRLNSNTFTQEEYTERKAAIISEVKEEMARFEAEMCDFADRMSNRVEELTSALADADTLISQLQDSSGGRKTSTATNYFTAEHAKLGQAKDVLMKCHIGKSIAIDVGNKIIFR